MSKIYHVAKREFITTIKTKTFILSIIMTPLFAVGGYWIAQTTKRSVEESVRPLQTIVVSDGTGMMREELNTLCAQHNEMRPNQPIALEFIEPVNNHEHEKIEALKTRVRNGEVAGVLLLPDQALAGVSGYHFTRTRDMRDITDAEAFQSTVQTAAANVRMRLQGLSVELVEALRSPIPLERVDLTERGEHTAHPMMRLMTPFFFLFMMFMAVFGTSSGMLTSVIDEKNSRVMEVLLSAVTPMQLMAGKILGLAAVGFLIIGIWTGLAAWGVYVSGLADSIEIHGPGWLAAFLVLGFLLNSCLYAAAGSACNDLKEAQSLVMPISIIVMIPFFSWFYVANNPNSVFAHVLSYIPFTAPMTMVLRMAVMPDMPLWQKMLSLISLLVAVPIVLWAASRIFRIGVLMYGKPPTPMELMRWVWR